MHNWIFLCPQEGCTVMELPSLAERKGSARLKQAAEVLGEDGARSAAAAAGAYLLEDDLCLQLRLQGLELPENGEVRALSPARWGISEGHIPDPSQMRGIVLEPSEKSELESFAGGRKAASAADVVELASHYFYHRRIKVLLAYTEPRFHRS